MDKDVLDVAIIGAGFGGLAMARALHAAGREHFRVFEQADAVGGTWRDNIYPGAACDVPSHLYSLGSAPKPDWSRVFAAQPEIRAYLDTLAAPLLRADRIATGFRMVRAQWDAVLGAWTIDAADGRRVQAHTLVLALGGLHHAAWPELPGREHFAGLQLHTARWRDDIDLRGKRVALIGTGASAIQLVPAIVDQVERLHVLQRTPAWLLPRPDHAIPIWLQRVFAHVPGVQTLLRGAIFTWLEALGRALLMPRTAFWARALARRHLRKQVPDAALRARLTPDYPIGCKRVLLSNDFYPALQHPQCELVDASIATLERDGVRLRDGRLLAVDAIVYATGFTPMDVLRDVEIVGRDGRRLADDWRERPVAHLGIGVHGYPNLALLLGPNTALGHNSALYMIECQVRHVLATLRHREARGARAIEPSADAQREFIAALDRAFRGTAWAGGCRSWYLDAQGRNIALWIGSALAYRRRTGTVRAEEYLLDA